MTTTAARSRDWLRKEGWIAEVVEKRSGSFVRRDLYDFGDVLAYKPGVGILIAQGYLYNAAKDHELLFPETNEKIKGWLESGGLFWHMSWRMIGKRGKRKFWTVETKEVKLNGR